jgi:glycosyltransferase involved in cell wall biosynthesis
MKKIKILFIIPNLHGGGAQKCFVNLVNNINLFIFDVKLIVFDTTNSAFINDVSTNIEIINLRKKRVRYGLLKLFTIIKKEKPDVILSTLTQINIPLVFFKIFLFKKIIFIAREANLVSQNLNRYKFKFFWRFCYKFFYKKFDQIICISKTQSIDLVTNFNSKMDKISIIYNPIQIDKCNSLADKKVTNTNYSIFDLSSNKMHYVAVGSLSIQKGFDNLISAFNLLKDKNYHLYILGEGPLRIKLQNKINLLNLSRNITLVGFECNPYMWIKNADFFILSSVYEGAGTVLFESITLGTPILALPAFGVTDEILDNIDGCHVSKFNTSESLSNLILENYNKRYKLEKKYLDRFDSTIIIKQYENTILKLIN